MEISVPKTKVRSFFAEGAPITAFACNGLPVEQVNSFKYLGLQFHKSGDIVHLIEPIKHKALDLIEPISWLLGSCSAASLFVCTVNIHQSIFELALHYGCKVWGMHNPDAGSDKRARLDLQMVYDFYLRVVCGLSSTMPRSMLLTE